MKNFKDLLQTHKDTFLTEETKLARQLADLEIDTLTSQHISALAKKRRTIELLIVLLMSACAIALLACFVVCVCLVKEGYLLGIAFIPFIPLDIICLITAINLWCKFLKSSEEKFAKLQLQEQYASVLRKAPYKRTCALRVLLDKLSAISADDDKKILSLLSNNKNLLHRLILKLDMFSLSKGITPSVLSLITRCAYSNQTDLTINTLQKFISRIDKQEKIQLYLDCHRQNYQYSPPENSIEFHNRVMLLDDIDTDLLNFALGKGFVSIPDTQDYFLYSQLITTKSKIFVLAKEITKIIENEELLTMLTNAYRENSDILEIAALTHVYFLESFNLEENSFPLILYAELLRVLFSTIINCRGFYSKENLALDFDFTSINFDEIANKIIEQKLFRKYDVEKLLISILYERFDIYVSLYDFFTDLSKISSLCETIHKFKIKDDLLNGTHIPCRKSIVDIDLMTGTEFEEFLCIFFTNQGYKCQTTKASGDQGIDLIAVKDDVKLAIQAKCYTGSVGNHAVMEAVAGTKYYKANRTMVITNSTFTKSAIELAKANNVILWDRQALIEKISKNP